MQTLWEKQSRTITFREIRETILNGKSNSGAMIEQWLNSWRQEYEKFVEEHMLSVWIVAMQEGAKQIEKKIPGWQFNATESNVQRWIKQHGAQFVTNFTQAQLDGLGAVLRRAATSRMNVDELSRVIRTMVGMNWRQSMANLNYYRSTYDRLIKEGSHTQQAEKKALEQAILYGQRQHRYHGYNIAETELAFAYNQGALHAVKQAQSMCLLGMVVKRWRAAEDTRTCFICKELNNTTIDIDEDFQYREKGVLFPINPDMKNSDSHLVPPAHPFCRCWIEFEEISPPDPATRFDEIKEIRQPDGLHPEDRYDIIAEISENMLGDIRQYIQPDGSFDLEQAKSDYEKFLDIVPIKNRWLLLHVFETVNYRQTNNPDIVFGYNLVQDMFVYNPDNKRFTNYDFSVVMTHEMGHRIDYLFVQTEESKALSDAIAQAEIIFNKNPDVFVDYVERYYKRSLQR